MARTLFFKIIVVVSIELSLSSFDADNARRQLAGHLLQVGRRSSRTPVTRREHVEVAVVGSPNGLVVLRFLASACKADFIGFYDNRSFVETVSAVNGDEGIVRILGGRNLPGCVASGTAATVTRGDECLVRDLFREGVHAIVAHAHRND